MNIYALKNPAPDSESFTTLYQTNTLKIEAIKSHLLAPGEIYYQEENEWVVLLKGDAQLRVEDKTVDLKEGDFLFLAKHTVHQVLSTSKDALWLGVFSS